VPLTPSRRGTLSEIAFCLTSSVVYRILVSLYFRTTGVWLNGESDAPAVLMWVVVE